MAPPDWSSHAANADFLALKNPELLKEDNYKVNAAKTANIYYGNHERALPKIQNLVAEDFPPRKELTEPLATSGPQGNVTPFTLIDDPAAWKAVDWEGREEEYTYRFTAQDIQELWAGVEGLRARGLTSGDDLKALSKEDFPLPTLAPKLIALSSDFVNGRGFQFLRGFPVDKYKEDPFAVIAAYWGLLQHIGRTQISQNDYDEATGQIEGSVLNHIGTLGHKRVDGKDITFNSQRELRFHDDQGATDLVSLLCIHGVKEGGVSKYLSTIEIHNELLRRGRKDLVEVLSKPFLLPKYVTQSLYYVDPEGRLEAEPIVPFEYHDGFLSIYFQATDYYNLEKEGVKLTPLQEEAIWAVLAIANNHDFHFRHKLEAGDIEWIHNPTIFHAREGYTDDGPGLDERRHVVRSWLQTYATKRPIAPSFAPRSSVQAGGGFKVAPGAKINLPILPLAVAQAKAEAAE